MSRSFGTIGTLADCLSGLNVTDNSIFVGEDVRDVWDVFEQQKLLGTGAFGTVYRAKANGADAKVVAVKQLPKDTVDVQDAYGGDSCDEGSAGESDEAMSMSGVTTGSGGRKLGKLTKRERIRERGQKTRRDTHAG